MDAYTGIEMLEELKEIVKELRVESDKLWPPNSPKKSPSRLMMVALGLDEAADKIEKLISKYDVK